MSSGIVEETGTLRTLRRQGASAVLGVDARVVLDGLRIGDSVAVNGTCLTVTGLSPEGFAADVAPATLRRTNLGLLQPGHAVNLERSVMVGGRIGGHFVQGHVDGVGRVSALQPEGNAIVAEFEADAEIMRYIVMKGFVAVDGMSLTVVRRGGTRFAISLIPHTRSSSIAGRYRVGQVVNLEVDVLAKYVEQLLGGPSTGAALSRSMLERAGFLE
jgi:riboflavin synthase